MVWPLDDSQGPHPSHGPSPWFVCEVTSSVSGVLQFASHYAPSPNRSQWRDCFAREKDHVGNFGYSLQIHINYSLVFVNGTPYALIA